MTSLTVHPDRFFAADPAAKGVARSLYSTTERLPIVSPHGHVSARMLSENRPFRNPADLLITPDHYITRLLHSVGVPLEQLGLKPAAQPGPQTEPTSVAEPREVWRTFCEHWQIFLGTPVRSWIEHELASVLAVHDQLSATNADELYDGITQTLSLPEFRPLSLLDRFGISVLATTDGPADDLSAHAALRADPRISCSVIPTMRADAYTDPSSPHWRDRLAELEDVGGQDCGTYAGLLAALRARRDHFRQHGATAIDCGPVDAWAIPLSDSEAERLHSDGMARTISDAGAVAYRRNLLYQFGAMSAEDGLVMQLHPGVTRNHHAATYQRFGPDTGHDLPTPTSFTEPLRSMLNDFGTARQFRIVLFTVDETAFSREIAPLAGFYPSVFAGAPWWFLDAPAAILRYRAAVTETAGFYKTSGFIDDTRALCSIPARHDMSRRLDARYLADLVVSHQLDEADAARIAMDLAHRIPLSTFRLGG